MNNVYNNGIDLSVTVNGRPTRIYTHEGRYFIESREGTEYVIEIKNNNSYRVEAVVAVDGLSVMNGEKAAVDDYGYVIAAWSSIKIKGYRKSMEEVGAFKFTRKENSYAADKGDASNVGVIALAVWKEKQPTYSIPKITIGTSSPTWIYPSGTTYGSSSGSATHIGNVVLDSNTAGSLHAYHATASNCSTGAGGTLLRSVAEPQLASFSHGTTWGQQIEDRVVTTKFERDCIIAQTEVFYNSKENLEAMGIKLVQEKQVNLPVGFPGSFATPPTGWKS